MHNVCCHYTLANVIPMKRVREFSPVEKVVKMKCKHSSHRNLGNTKTLPSGKRLAKKEQTTSPNSPRALALNPNDELRTPTVEIRAGPSEPRGD